MLRSEGRCELRAAGIAPDCGSIHTCRVHHRNNVLADVRVQVLVGLGGHIAPPMPERVHDNHPEAIGERLNIAAISPLSGG